MSPAMQHEIATTNRTFEEAVLGGISTRWMPSIQPTPASCRPAARW